MNVDDFKSVMRRWASTVTIITTKADEQIYGLTATAFSSLGISPPTVFVCINGKSRTHGLVAASGVFCVNFLTPKMKSISDRFAGRMPDVERFAGLAHHPVATGSPVLDDALAFLDCKIVDSHVGGDHTIFIGEVLAGALMHADEGPLMYYSGAYHMLGDKAA